MMEVRPVCGACVVALVRYADASVIVVVPPAAVEATQELEKHFSMEVGGLEAEDLDIWCVWAP